jgi:cyclase
MKAVLLVLVASMALPVSSFAEVRIADGFSTDWSNLKMESRQLAPHLYLMHGSGGNTLASIGPDGTLLVDPAFAQVAPTLKKALQDMGAGPVRYVIDTHYHSDHSGGNGAFANDGAAVVGQDNCRARMMQTQHSSFWGSTTPPSHTDGDTIVYFHKANVVHMGDIFVNNLFPYIDPTREFDTQNATNRVDGDGFVAMVYQGLTGRRLDWHPAKK